MLLTITYLTQFNIIKFVIPCLLKINITIFSECHIIVIEKYLVTFDS